ncbi:hypothetical protein C9374_006493 [Naegleria lovaniensis]|uniref:Uncharacterized protein n=1 Tax=Naegleria lovaniensis TaxID=51637 RepID=A0AA88GM46_NAELO|nr:uncharacterized protein C9374_006493 [Naegleria lovaniensis]KAG2381504.1 hypothetical protein C9374_006493 [Naegleria lovaniensis]
MTEPVLDIFSLPYTLFQTINATQGKIADANENIASLSNSAFYVIVLTVLLAVLIGYYIKLREEMKRKQTVLFFLTGLLVVVELAALFFRIVYNGTSVYMNGTNWIAFPNLLDYRIVLWVFAVFENSLSFGAIVTITIIIGFLQDLFLTTAAAAGAMSKKAYIIIRWSLFAFNMITGGILGIIILLNAILNLLVKMTLLNRTLAVPFQIVLLCIFFIVNVANLVVFTVPLWNEKSDQEAQYHVRNRSNSVSSSSTTSSYYHDKKEQNATVSTQSMNQEMHDEATKV